MRGSRSFLSRVAPHGALFCALAILSGCADVEYNSIGYRNYSEPTLSAALDRMYEKQFANASYASPAHNAVEMRPGVIIYPYDGAYVSNQQVYSGSYYVNPTVNVAPVEAMPLGFSRPPVESAYPQWEQGY